MNNTGFKIIALRVHEKCEPYIRKCLKEGSFYYLNHDYLISEDGARISTRYQYLQPLSDDFYSIPEPIYNDSAEETIRFNVSAIVGMNGDGKSSLVELALRIVNNYAFKHRHKNLLYIKGIYADLYLSHNGNFYTIKCEGHKVKSYKYEEVKKGVWVMIPEKMDCPEFYTMVSNYSLYAYNEYEYWEEWMNNSDVEGEEKCWLHHVFHKNDGYQAPLSIHPFRQKGNIDINREKELSMQRLLSVILRGEDSEKNSFRYVNGKYADILNLKRRKKSHLQTEIFEKKLKVLKSRDLLDTFLLKCNKILDSIDGRLNHDEELEVLDALYKKLNMAYDKFLSPYSEQYRLIYEWAEKNYITDTKSDTSRLLRAMDQITAKLHYNVKDTRGFVFLKSIRNFSFSQIQYLYCVLCINAKWETGLALGGDAKLDSVSVEFKKVLRNSAKTEEEECREYILYKTISIFETYSIYKNPFRYWLNAPQMLYDDTVGLVDEKGYVHKESYVVDFAFEVLMEDWKQRSHITLKLRQAYNYWSHIKDGAYYLYNDPDIFLNFDKERKNTDRIISISKLQEKYPTELRTLDNMPSHIFAWDIVYQKGTDKIELSKFSSGEKQRLYSLSAIVYHLLNIDSISSQEGNIQYSAVNLILEEIELYFHPEWQRTLIQELMRCVRSFKYDKLRYVNVILVTHSPFVLSDIPKTNVLFLQGGIPVEKMQENTFGANINSLLKNGFFLPSLPMGEFAHEKINSLFAALYSGDFAKESLDEIYQHILLVGEPFIRKQLLSLYNGYVNK